MKYKNKKFRCVLHGSYRKHFKEILEAHKLFTEAGIEVLAPEFSEIARFEDGFAILESDEEEDHRMIELLYLHHLKSLGENGFSYFVNPDGYIGKSASYELGIAQTTNVKCFFLEQISDHPAYLHKNSIISPEVLIKYINKKGSLPEPKAKRNEYKIHKMWEDLVIPGSIVAVGGIIEHENAKYKEVLLVKTHKWGDKYSVVGGRVKRNERLEDALSREVKEETGLSGYIGQHICTFDQIKNSGYYAPVQHVFVDKVVRVKSKKVVLNDEAQEYIWLPPKIALKELDIEPNARHTLEIYSSFTS